MLLFFSCTKRLCVETKMAFSIWSILPTICKFSLSSAKKFPFGENLLTVSFSKYSRKAKRFHAKKQPFCDSMKLSSCIAKVSTQLNVFAKTCENFTSCKYFHKNIWGSLPVQQTREGGGGGGKETQIRRQQRTPDLFLHVPVER